MAKRIRTKDRTKKQWKAEMSSIPCAGAVTTKAKEQVAKQYQ